MIQMQSVFSSFSWMEKLVFNWRDVQWSLQRTSLFSRPSSVNGFRAPDGGGAASALCHLFFPTNQPSVSPQSLEFLFSAWLQVIGQLIQSFDQKILPMHLLTFPCRRQDEKSGGGCWMASIQVAFERTFSIRGLSQCEADFAVIIVLNAEVHRARYW